MLDVTRPDAGPASYHGTRGEPLVLPWVTIVVLNWNRRQDTLECLASLMSLAYPRCEVAVVDNASRDGSVAAVRQSFPQVTVLENPSNLGYAGGNNVGLRWALARGADQVLLLNNDTIVHPDFLGELVRASLGHPEAGILGPTIYFYDQPAVVWSAGGAIDWGRGQSSMIDLYERGPSGLGTARPVDFVTGCALLVKASVVARIGPLDERFFSYWEEVDFCVRARRAGFGILHVPQSRIWHKISPASQQQSPQICYYMARNRLLFLQSCGADWRAWLWCLAEYARTLASLSLRPKHRHQKPQRDALLMGIQDFLRGRLGEASRPEPA